MRFFDPNVHSDVRSDDDLENLAYFGTERIVVCSHAPQRFERAEQLLDYFEYLLADEVHRVERFGLRAQLALGVHPLAAPRRTFAEVWRELPTLLRENRVVAIGELGIAEGTSREYGLLEHQMRLAAELDVPCIVRAPSHNTAAVVRQMLACIRRAGLAPHRVLLCYRDLPSVGILPLPANLRVSGTLEPSRVLSSAWAAGRAQLDDHQVCLSAGLTVGPGDVLAFNRAALALQDQGMDHHTIDRWCYGNALDFFQPSQVNPTA